MLIEAELTRHKSCGTLMAEFIMRWKPSMRQPGERERCAEGLCKWDGSSHRNE